MVSMGGVDGTDLIMDGRVIGHLISIKAESGEISTAKVIIFDIDAAVKIFKSISVR